MQRHSTYVEVRYLTQQGERISYVNRDGHTIVLDFVDFRGHINGDGSVDVYSRAFVFREFKNGNRTQSRIDFNFPMDKIPEKTREEAKEIVLKMLDAAK